MNYWLVKSEPDVYSWQTLLKEGSAIWDGVRNYQARNNLKAMKKGDAVLFYHSNIGLEVVGISKVIVEAFPDPTAKEGDWVAVKLAPERALKTPVSLQTIKSHPRLKGMALVRHSRLSVMPVQAQEFDTILSLAEN